MGFIDWSDAEEMLGLLIEYVSDEKNEAFRDREREGFLAKLLAELKTIKKQDKAIHELKAIYDSIDDPFKEDAVTIHVKDCIQELERLQ